MSQTASNWNHILKLRWPNLPNETEHLRIVPDMTLNTVWVRRNRTFLVLRKSGFSLPTLYLGSYRELSLNVQFRLADLANAVLKYDSNLRLFETYVVIKIQFLIKAGVI